MRRRRGMSALETVVALGMLVAITLPLVGLIASSTRVTAGGERRLALELRARQVHAACAGAGYAVLVRAGSSSQGGQEPARLLPGLGGPPEGVEERLSIRELDEGLLLVESQELWTEGTGVSHRRALVVRRLRVCPTLSLDARYTLDDPAAQEQS